MFIPASLSINTKEHQAVPVSDMLFFIYIRQKLGWMCYIFQFHRISGQIKVYKLQKSKPLYVLSS